MSICLLIYFSSNADVIMKSLQYFTCHVSHALQLWR